MGVYMAKRKLRAWTKKDIAELKAHSKARTPVSKISKVMETNGWGVKTESWDCRDQIGPSSLGTGTSSG
jgi:hypothetical protein